MPTFIQSSTAGLNGTSVSATFPAQPITGNLLVAVHHTQKISASQAPAGWSLGRMIEAEGHSLLLYYRIAGASEPTMVTVTSAWATAHNQTLSIMEYSGVRTTNPLDRTMGDISLDVDLVSSFSTSSTGQTRLNDELVIAVIGTQGSATWSGSWSNGFTQRLDRTGGTGGASTFSSHAVADKILSAKDNIETTGSWTTARRANALICTFYGTQADPPAPPANPRRKVWDGASFVQLPREAKRWTGSAWATGTLKHWDGAIWAKVVPTGEYDNFVPWSQLGITSVTDAVITRSTIIDVALAQAKSVTIEPGVTLAFSPDTSITLESTNNIIVRGKLKMRPTDGTKVHTVSFPSIDESTGVGGGDVVLASDTGLWFESTGVWDAVGATKKAWTRLVSSAIAGDGSIVVVDATGWRVGDIIVVCPHEPPTVANHWTHYDERTITSITGVGPYTIGLSSNLTYPHTNVTIEGIVHATEVLNLTRNVKVTGTPTGRTHVMLMGGGHTIKYVESINTGPRNRIGVDDFIQNTKGRYSFHIHELKGKAVGMVLEGCVSRLAGGHAFVAHESHGVTFKDCIAHDVFDDPFWYDAFVNDFVDEGQGSGHVPAPHDLLFDGCVASLVKTNPSFRGIRLSGFAIGRGTGNKIINCAAVGVQGSVDSAGFAWREAAVGVFDFDQNTSHNNKRHGVFAWQNTHHNHIVSNTVSYWNAHAGFSHGAYVNFYEYTAGNIAYGNLNSGLLLSAQNHPTTNLYGPLKFESVIFDGAGIGLYSVVNGEHSLTGSGNVEIRVCTLKGYTTAAIAITSEVTVAPDQVAFIDCTFSGAEDTWLSFSSSAHEDSVVVIQNGNSNGITYECHRSDFAGGTFHAPWNCKRLVI